MCQEVASVHAHAKSRARAHSEIREDAISVGRSAQRLIDPDNPTIYAIYKQTYIHFIKQQERPRRWGVLATIYYYVLIPKTN